MRVQNLTDGRLPTWRYGRTWWWKWEICWKAPGERIGASIRWLGFSIRAFLFELYVSPRRRSSLGRELDVYWMDGCLWIHHPFERDGGMEWRSTDPWWRKAVCLHVVDWLIGRPKYSERRSQEFVTYIPMPEGCYLATATPSRCEWRRRWYWPTRVVDSVWLEIRGGGIPHSGKGENSWDCGDDGLCGIGGTSLEDAIANAVKSALLDRRRYGHDSRRTGSVPSIVVNEPKEAA